MRAKDKDRCPIKARKRAAADLRCAARKLGLDDATAILVDMGAATDDPAAYRRKVDALRDAGQAVADWDETADYVTPLAEKLIRKLRAALADLEAAS